jgi:putative GTP pyrophosphokinase
VNQQEILDRWESEKPLYEAWARFIAREVEEHLVASIAPVKLDYFLKVPTVPRLKTSAALVDKALHRNKNYENPYDDITDKVGMRYVVLLTPHISQLCGIIESAGCAKFWTWTKDKDYEAEKLAKPLEFSYQSVHYVLRSKAGLAFEGVELPAGLTCEVQLRTLLQHAHSELTHDTLYKPKTIAKPAVKRTVAKSMALIEATDEFFAQAMADLAAVDAPQNEVLRFLADAYRKGTRLEPGDERSNPLVIDTFAEFLPQNAVADIEAFLKAKSYVFERIKAQRGQRQFFSQPAILLAYYLADKQPARVKAEWPIDDADLQRVFSDLGIKY